MRWCNRANEAAIAGVMLRHNRMGNSLGVAFRLFASGEMPLPDGDTLGDAGEMFAGASTCREVAAAAVLIEAASSTAGRGGQQNPAA